MTGRSRTIAKAALLLVGLAAVWWFIWGRGVGLPPRTVGHLAFPIENPFAAAWRTEDAFPGVTFDQPLLVVPEAGQPDRYFVAQKNGLILTIKAGTPAESSPFLDLRSHVITRGEAGFVGLATHPRFGTTASPEGRYVYVFYVAGQDGRFYDRLSRFERLAGENRADPASETVLIDQLDEDSDHNAGQLVFGPDGFLYVGVGDEGGIGDQFGNGQRIDRDLFSGILRLDPDCRPGVSHPIRNQPETGRTQRYCIPNDNPFVGRPGALEEFWSIGLRNPYRFNFDGTALIGGDVGQDRREKVFVAKRGSNHQWSYREGTLSFSAGPFGGQRPAIIDGTETDPVYEYPHTNGNGCVIGGYVYRGRAFPELQGQFVFGDFNSGRIWAMTVPGISGASVSRLQTLLQLPPDQRIASFGLDSDGELLLCPFNARASILRLRRRE